MINLDEFDHVKQGQAPLLAPNVAPKFHRGHVSVVPKAKKLTAFKRGIVRSPLNKKMTKPTAVALITERAKRAASKTIAFMLKTSNKAPQLGVPGSRLDNKKKPFNPDHNFDIERQYLTSAGTASFAASKVKRLSTPGRLEIDEAFNPRIDQQEAYVVSRNSDVVNKGRQRRLLEDASQFLERETSAEGKAKAKKRHVSKETLLKWQEELVQDIPRTSFHRYAVYNEDRKQRGHEPNSGILPPMDRTEDVKKNQRRIAKDRRSPKARKQNSPIQMPSVSSAPYFKKEPFSTVTTPMDFKSAVRAANPSGPVKTLEAFLRRCNKAIAPKTNNKGYGASSFSPAPSTLILSSEMKQSIQQKIHNEADRNFWSGFWDDPVCSVLADTMDANVFVESESLGPHPEGVAPMLVTKMDVINRARNENVEKVFPYVPQAHQAACIIQKMFHARRRRLVVAASSLARIYRGFEVRRNHLDWVNRKRSAAVVIQAFFRGVKARVRVAFLRKTTWNMVALTGQRVVRGHLGRLRFKRLWAERDFFCAQQIQKRYRGVLGRRQAAAWRAFVYDRSSRRIQKMVRWYHFRQGYQRSVRAFVLFATNHQRLWRGTRGRIIARRRRLRQDAAITIQRTCARGYAGRKFAREKMRIFRSACTVIQTRWRGIMARVQCPIIRQNRIDAEKERRVLEERAVEIKVKEYEEYLMTKQGKKDFKKQSKKVKKSRRRVAKKRVRMSKQEKHMHDIIEAFELFDTDGSGSVDHVEFKAVCKELGIDMHDDEIDEAMERMDEDGNGVADFEEFAVWFESLDQHGVKMALIRAKLKTQKFFRDLFGFSTKAHTKQSMLANVRKETLKNFRVAHPPPFQCDDCLKKFVFSYELERHRGMQLTGKDHDKCPGLYHPVKQILAH